MVRVIVGRTGHCRTGDPDGCKRRAWGIAWGLLYRASTRRVLGADALILVADLGFRLAG